MIKNNIDNVGNDINFDVGNESINEGNDSINDGN